MNVSRRVALFTAVCALQIGAVGVAVARHEYTLARGTPMRFKLAPVDPIDPIRGRYVQLRFDAQTTNVPRPETSSLERSYFATLATDANGFAYVRELRRDRPSDGDYLVVRVNGYGDEGVRIAFGFDRFYAEESAARRIEEGFARNPDPMRTYAVVRVRAGHGVIESLVVNGVDASTGVGAAGHAP